MKEYPVVRFTKATHKGLEVLLVGFAYNFELKEYLKMYEGIQWSTQLKSFYLPFDRETTNALFHYLRARKYYIDYSALTLKGKVDPGAKPEKKVHLGTDISLAVQEKIMEFTDWMRQRRYSSNTINTYENMLRQFFRFLHPKPYESLNERDILDFNTEYILANGFSHTYQNQAISALKLFYRELADVSVMPVIPHRPKKPKRLPEVLSLQEVQAILSATTNLKHKTLLSLLYACGLRIGEALKLTVLDLDLKRRYMHVKCAKGFKDRYVPIPERMVSLLTEYNHAYSPVHFVFEGHDGGMYSAVSARQVLKRTLEKVGLQRPITLHTLRHSHATHLLENGTDLRFIQELLGHNSPKTTMIYTHVSSTSLDKIKNPFNDFDL